MKGVTVPPWWSDDGLGSKPGPTWVHRGPSLFDATLALCNFLQAPYSLEEDSKNVVMLGLCLRCSGATPLPRVGCCMLQVELRVDGPKGTRVRVTTEQPWHKGGNLRIRDAFCAAAESYRRFPRDALRAKRAFAQVGIARTREVPAVTVERVLVPERKAMPLFFEYDSDIPQCWLTDVLKPGECGARQMAGLVQLHNTASVKWLSQFPAMVSAIAQCLVNLILSRSTRTYVFPAVALALEVMLHFAAPSSVPHVKRAMRLLLSDMDKHNGPEYALTGSILRSQSWLKDKRGLHIFSEADDTPAPKLVPAAAPMAVVPPPPPAPREPVEGGKGVYNGPAQPLVEGAPPPSPTRKWRRGTRNRRPKFGKRPFGGFDGYGDDGEEEDWCIEQDRAMREERLLLLCDKPWYI